VVRLGKKNALFSQTQGGVVISEALFKFAKRQMALPATGDEEAVASMGGIPESKRSFDVRFQAALTGWKYEPRPPPESSVEGSGCGFGSGSGGGRSARGALNVATPARSRAAPLATGVAAVAPPPPPTFSELMAKLRSTPLPGSTDAAPRNELVEGAARLLTNSVAR